jgi:hypothetical protein
MIARRMKQASITGASTAQLDAKVYRKADVRERSCDEQGSF